MRVYIIGNDGIALCRKATATVNDGEIAVGSNEELRAAPLSAKRLLALWNALPGVEKRKKVGCTDQQPGAVSPRSDILREANVLRPAKFERAVQRGGSNGHLGRLPASGPERSASPITRL